MDIKDLTIRNSEFKANLMPLSIALVTRSPRKARRIPIEGKRRYSTRSRSTAIRLLEGFGQGADSRYTYGGTSEVLQSGGGEEDQGGRRSCRVSGIVGSKKRALW